MRLPSLERDPEQQLVEAMARTQTHEPSWHFADELTGAGWDCFSACDEAGMRAPIAHGHSEALSTAHHYIGSHISRGL